MLRTIQSKNSAGFCQFQGAHKIAQAECTFQQLQVSAQTSKPKLAMLTSISVKQQCCLLSAFAVFVMQQCCLLTAFADKMFL